MSEMSDSTKYRCAVATSGNGSVSGVVGHSIIVLPNMAPEHAVKLLDAKVRGVVAEVGGMLCHFAIVARERKIPVLILANACKLLVEGDNVELHPERMLVITCHHNASNV